ncbi:MAG TPA: PP2C family protein-serine/threonine phosphatase [Candidatus Polarisedimenticolaceae bacterium]|nr:PP2C family protein-serine/threonine phosphatase [Candidatus Polarisedimenticolaceae bacterium]
MNYKDLFRKLERHLAQIQRSEDLAATLWAILKRLVDDYGELGIVGGRIYARRGGHYALQHEYPVRRAPRGFKIPASYKPVRDMLEHGIVQQDLRDPGVDPKIERALGVKNFAAIAVGDRGEHLMAFTLRPRSGREHVIYTLNTIRHVINSKFRQEQFADRVAEMRAIQMSLLPRTAPAFAGFDVWGATRPAEEVGGDLYDFIAVSPRVLGIAIADSAGHGLPAALQARDAIIGLRMGVEERLRITATVEKLNKVVSHSALASKFISLFYGEVEKNGNMVYVNAGHAPPLLRGGAGLSELTRGGLVLGPSPDALYERGYVTLEPGDVLLGYTDGITEAENPAGDAYGVDRLRDLLLRKTWTSARELVEAVLADVDGYVGSDLRVDDQTLVAVVRRR